MSSSSPFDPPDPIPGSHPKSSSFPPPVAQRSSLLHSVILKAVVPLMLVLAGAGSTVGGEAFELAAMHHTNPTDVVLELPSTTGDESFTLYHNHTPTAVPAPDKSPDGHHHDCPPLVQDHLRILGIQSDLQDIHKELDLSGSGLVNSLGQKIGPDRREERDLALDIARDRLKALMERLAPCLESAEKT
jgi:hypothetical protein